ncbi:MAG: hypothetical protein AAGJ82_07695 [Bacteroidota bacterium]
MNYSKSSTTPNAKARFKKSLSTYLGYNLIVFIFMILGVGTSFLMKISVIWGAILAIKWYRYTNRAEQKTRAEAEDFEQRRSKYVRPRRPEWKDKDLV